VHAFIASPSDAFGLNRANGFGRFGASRFSGWLKHNSNSYGDAVTDDLHANNDAAISKLEDTIREKKRHETLTAKLSNPTEEMMLAGALAHNAGLRPMRAAISAGEAKRIFVAMTAVLKESII
jgi:hypothetical protein